MTILVGRMTLRPYKDQPFSFKRNQLRRIALD